MPKPAPIHLVPACLLALCCCRPAANGSVTPDSGPSPDLYGTHEPVDSHTTNTTILYHQARVDRDGLLLSWVPDGSPYHKVVTLAFGRIKATPAQANGLPTYFTSSMFSPDPGNELGFDRDWVHHPAGVAAMLIDSSLAYSMYSGDVTAVRFLLPFADHILAHGLTAATDDWPLVPYACSNFGELTYGGADQVKYCPKGAPACGIGDGYGIIEPDKVGEMGHAYARLFKATAEPRYLQEALACADTLVRHAREGNAQISPWPFRVDARTGKDIREEYSANVLGPMRLFDELVSLGKGNVAAYRTARDKALAWLIRYPVQNNLWDGYFEDIAIAQPGENPNQYTPLETARYLMHHPEVDPEWRAHVANLLKWVTGLFTVDVSQNVFEPGRQFGAEILSEQRSDMAKMASHTARFASILALFYEKTGDADSRRRAFRSFNWATYACADNGVVTVSPNPREGYWFSDGYGDYIRHFIAGMASVPVWAPTGENHILRSTSVMVELSVTADRVAYTAFDADGDEVLRLAKAPMSIAMGGRNVPLTDSALQVIPMAPGGVALRIKRRGAKNVVVSLATPPPAASVTH